MDWEQHFVDFMLNTPGGHVVLGIIGGLAALTPVIVKMLPHIREHILHVKTAKSDAKKTEEEQKAKEEEERQRQIASEQDFRNKVTTVVEALPDITNKLTDLSKTVETLKETADKMLDSNASLSENITALDKKVDKLEDKVGKIDESSYNGDKRLQESIVEMRNNLQTVTDKVSLIIESDLDDFRNYLLEMHNRHVYEGEPITKRDIELLCMKFRKYDREGGNGWAKQLYRKILQCETPEGIRAEDIAKQLHYLIETSTPSIGDHT